MSFARRLLPGLLILALGLGHWAGLRPGHEWGDDFALYLLHARNLVEGRPYAQTGYLYNPHYPSIGPPTYPPVTPLLLAPVYAAAGLNLAAMKLVMIGCFVVFLGMAYLVFCGSLGPPRSALLVALLGLNWYFLRQSNTIGSDAPFLAFLYLAIFLFDKAERAAKGSLAEWLLPLGAGVAAYLAFGARSLGALLVVGMVIRAVLNRRTAFLTLVALVPFGALAAVQNRLVHSDLGYLDQLGAGPGVLAQHAAWYAERLAAFWSNGRWPLPAILLAAATMLLALLGFAQRVRKQIGVVEIFAVLYVVAILLWPSYEAERYLFPVIPLWLFYAFCGLDHPWFARARKAILGLLLVAAALCYAGRYAALDWGPLPHGVHTPEARDLFRAIADRTRPDDLVLFAKPRAMALMTRRPSAAPQVTAGDEELSAYIRSIGAAYVVVTNRDGVLGRADNPSLSAFLRAYVARHPDQFSPVCSNADFTLYRMRSR